MPGSTLDFLLFFLFCFMPTGGLAKREQLFTGRGGGQLKTETQKREMSDRRASDLGANWCKKCQV
jgi:hypothetical protein